jgi:hypothetical protein
MASVLKLKTDIKKLKAAIASKATSGAIKTKLRGKLTSLENELDKLQPNKRKPKTTGPKNESALVRLAKKRRTNQGLSTSKSDIERDAIRPAKKAGKRISASGNTYYEYRDNRVDNRQPPRKYRKLADGGMMARGGKVGMYQLMPYVSMGQMRSGAMSNLSSPSYKETTNFQGTQDEAIIKAKNMVDNSDGRITSVEVSIINPKATNVLKMTKKIEMVRGTKMDHGGYMADGGKIDYSKQTSDDFKLGEIVWDVDNERYGTIIGIYDGYLSDKYEVRLDTDGMQPTENLRKVGSEGDNGTKEQLKEEIDGYARLVKSYPENNYPKQIEPMLEKGGYMAKGGKTKDKEVVRGYFEDEAYEYAQGGNLRFNNVSIHISKNTEEDMRNAGFTFDPKGNAPLYYNGKEVGYLSNFNGVMLNDEYVDELVPMFNTFRDAGIWNYRGWKEEADARKRQYGNKMADGGMVEKLRKEFSTKELDDNLMLDGYKTEVFDYSEEEEAKRWVKKNSKDNYVVPYENDDDNYIYVVVPKHKMADGGSVAKGNYEMLMSQAKEVMHHAEELMQVVKPNMDIEAWVVSKAERATTDLSDITHYLDGLKMAMGGMVKHNAHKVNG